MHHLLPLPIVTLEWLNTVGSLTIQEVIQRDDPNTELPVVLRDKLIAVPVGADIHTKVSNHVGNALANDDTVADLQRRTVEGYTRML
jgi:F0F1-type ATP synthase beta subunit